MKRIIIADDDVPKAYREYESGYPSRPIGGGNPYYCCEFCGRSDPEINGNLYGHTKTCAWMLARIAQIKLQTAADDIALAVAEELQSKKSLNDDGELDVIMEIVQRAVANHLSGIRVELPSGQYW